MSIREPSLNILLINEHPDELKLVTSSLRGFFSDCRIEAGFSSEEALTFSQRAEWHMILIDQDLSHESGLNILARIRRNAPYAAIILQTNQIDSETAVQALQNGADFILFKNSPGFVTELLFSVQEAIEKRDLQMKLDRTFQRHLRFVETVSDLLYELDQDGRFVYVGSTVTAMLGYTPEELAGRHYSILLPPLQEAAGRFRLNERRAGSRSVRRFELTLSRKTLPDLPPLAIAVEVTAKGLFDNANRYIGTVGLL
ncbi:MAG: response regulator, partial [Nitrospira sp.]|nr:response regulator [Nitrospira sp.]